MRVRVPRDCPTLAEALARGADRIVLKGVVDLPAGTAGALLDRPVHITGGTLCAHGEWALIIGADVRLTGVAIENADGHGVRIVAGAPVLEDVELRVKGVAGVCEGYSRPVLRRVVVDGAENGWLLREDTAPDGDELAVNASGSALVTTDRAAGHLARLAVMSGDQFATIEASAQSRTTFAGLTVLKAGCGALHIYGESQVTVDGGHIRSSGSADPKFPAIEVRETAAPKLSDLHIENSAGRGMFLHGSCTPSLSGLRIDHSDGNGVEVRGDVVLDVRDLTVTDAKGAGVVVAGNTTGRLANVRTDATRNVGVGLGDQARVEVDGLLVRDADGAGLRVAGEARCVVRRVQAELLGCPGVWVHESAHLTLDTPSVRLNRHDGLKVEDEASLVVRRGTVAENAGRGLFAGGGARVRLDGVTLDANQGWSIEAANNASVKWSGGPLPARVSAAPGASLEDGSAADGAGDVYG